MKISVSILSELNNYLCALNKINETNSDYLHLDIMDGSFTDTSSFTFEDVKNIKKITNKKLDVHIMSTNLFEMINQYIKLNPEYITFHIENNNISEHIKTVKNNNIKVGLAVNPDTDISSVYPYLNDIDLILVMSVYPGRGGQKFILNVISKIQELKELQEEFNYKIEVDGGINDETINYIKNYADIFVVGSYITNSYDYQSKLDKIKC